MTVFALQRTIMATAAGRRRLRWELPVVGLCVLLGYGALYAGPVYRAAATTTCGWSQEAAAGAFALGFLVAISVPFLAGWAVDHWGARAVLAGGAVMAALGLFGAAASHALWHWYASTGARLLASTAQRRGSALGLIFGATGAGLALGPPLMQVLLDAVGWRAALMVEGVGLLLLAGIVVRGAQAPSEGVRLSPLAPGPEGGLGVVLTQPRRYPSPSGVPPVVREMPLDGHRQGQPDVKAVSRRRPM